MRILVRLGIPEACHEIGASVTHRSEKELLQMYGETS